MVRAAASRFFAVVLAAASARESVAQAPAPAVESYSVTIARLAGASVNLDSLYNEAVRRRVALDSAIRAAASGMFGPSASTLDVLRKMRTDPKLVMHDPDSIISAYANGLGRARAMLPKLIDTIVDGPIKVQSIPEAQAASSAPAAYRRANRDNPGDSATFLVNAYQPGGIACMNVLLGIAHEAYPGHHFETLYSLSRVNSVELTQSTAAFVEGWGIYSERLADEAGLYDADPVAKLGYLIHLFDVFLGLQIDIGMHARAWTHAMAVDTMLAVAGRPQSQAESYANRHAATPGQVASYGLGFVAIVKERERAEAALGSRFDVRRFHAVLLRDGRTPLPAMTKRVQAWLSVALSPGA